MTNLKLPKMSHENLNGKNGKIAYMTEVDTIESSGGGIVTVYHHNSVIAVMLPDTIIVDCKGYHTRTTCHRINAILRDNDTGANARIVNGYITVENSAKSSTMGVGGIVLVNTNNGNEWNMERVR